MGVRALEPGDLPAVIGSLLPQLNPEFSEQRWRRLFEYPWKQDDEPMGYGLFEEDKAVACAALVWGRIEDARGTVHRTCNISSWITLEGYRNRALGVVMPVLEDPTLTITNLTGITQVEVMFRRLGFRTLETHKRIIGPSVRSLPFKRRDASLDIELIPDGEELERSLPPSSKRVLLDLRDSAVCIGVLGPSGSTGLLIYTLGRHRGVRVAQIHHLDDPETFRSGLRHLQQYLFRRHGAILLELDERLLGGTVLEAGRIQQLPVPRLVRSPLEDLRPLTNAYSEMVLLGL